MSYVMSQEREPEIRFIESPEQKADLDRMVNNFLDVYQLQVNCPPESKPIVTAEMLEPIGGYRTHVGISGYYVENKEIKNVSIESLVVKPEQHGFKMVSTYAFNRFKNPVTRLRLSYRNDLYTIEFGLRK